jgi:hypothetical protein
MPAEPPVAPPPSSAPAQPVPSAPSPATPTKATVVATSPQKTAPAPSSLDSRPSRRGVIPPKEQPSEPLGTIDDAFSGIKKLGKREDGDPMDEESIQPTEQPKVEQDKEGQADGKEQATPEKAEDEVPVKEQSKPGNKKTNPWTLVETYKSKNHQLEQKLAELTTKSSEPPKEFSERLSAIEKRNQELEQHIRFVDYSKSQEFVDKYQKPYEEAWTRAIGGLKGLKLSLGTDPNTGQESSRDLTPQDIAALANMDPATARLEIKNRFPEDAAEVRSYIDKIRDLASAQNSALEEHKTKGGEWQQQQQQHARSMQEANAKLWKQFSDETVQKYDFLRPVEGDEERNSKLEKAAAFVADALSARPNDPNLTEEQRASVIKKHVALRNRAIAYSVLMHENKQLKAQLAEREEALKAFDSSSPTDGEGKGKQAAPNGDVTIEGVAAMLSKFGH